MKNPPIIFSDLDGTLLDYHTYSYSAAEEALQTCSQKHIPVVFCTSKTRSEMTYWRQQLNNEHPFIIENGGAIYIPQSYFPFQYHYHSLTEGYHCVKLGTNLKELIQVLKELQQHFDISSFLDWDADQIAKETGLSTQIAAMAREREFDIPFVIHNTDQDKDIFNTITAKGLTWTKGGRFYHLIGDNDKGKAVHHLIELFEKKEGTAVHSIGIGDSYNDFPMLNNVDDAYLIQRPDGSYVSDNYKHVTGIGPDGWNTLILSIINND